MTQQSLSNTYHRNFRFLLPCTMLFVAISTAIMSVVYKQVQLGHVIINAGAIAMPLYFGLTDLIAEIYGYKVIRQIIWYNVIAEFAFTLIVVALIHTPSPSSWNGGAAYLVVFDKLFRTFCAATISILFSTFINVYILTKWKILVKGRYFWLRSLSATALGEFLQVAIAFSILFIGVLPAFGVVKIIFGVYFIQVIGYFIIIYPVSIIVAFIKRLEGQDTFDYTTNFNPFKLNIQDKGKQ